MLLVERAAGLATVQDQGRRGWRAIGIPPGGAADAQALRLGNALVGNPPGAAGIETALGSLVLQFEQPTVFAVVGADGAILLDGTSVALGCTTAASAGQRLTLGHATSGRFRYLAVAGGIDVLEQLGSRSTYLPTGFGGHEGRRLTPGDRLPIGARGPGPCPGTALNCEPVPSSAARIRITGGPQSHLFPPTAFDLLVEAPYRIAPASDRMGSRLLGPALPLSGPASLPSEPTCLGAIQVPDDGLPIVILQDGPTVGGYPKIGAVIGTDLARFAQTPLGGLVQFRWVTLTEAQRSLRGALSEERRVLESIRD